MAASIKSLAFLCKIHHPEGSVSALFDTSVFQIVSTVHGVRQSLLVLGSLLGSLRGSKGLHAGHGSGLEFSPQSWIRLRPYLHDWLIQASSREKVLLSLRTFLRLCNSLGIVVDWEKSQLVAHQESFFPRSPIGLCQFLGFSSPVTSQQASLNWLPVSIMSGSTCVS